MGNNVMLVVKTTMFSDQKPTGVWSSQVETDYLRKWSERPAPEWLTKMEELAIVRTHSPLPDSQRWISELHNGKSLSCFNQVCRVLNMFRLACQPSSPSSAA